MSNDLANASSAFSDLLEALHKRKQEFEDGHALPIMVEEIENWIDYVEKAENKEARSHDDDDDDDDDDDNEDAPNWHIGHNAEVTGFGPRGSAGPDGPAIPDGPDGSDYDRSPLASIISSPDEGEATGFGAPSGGG
jgi:hypothetical protein